MLLGPEALGPECCIDRVPSSVSTKCSALKCSASKHSVFLYCAIQQLILLNSAVQRKNSTLKRIEATVLYESARVMLHFHTDFAIYINSKKKRVVAIYLSMLSM